MLPLSRSSWSQYTHAYGPATDVPALLQQLESYPPLAGDSPWNSLWGSLCHQGDVYPASFAAVPHIVRILAADPKRADFNYFAFPAAIEAARAAKGVAVPDELWPEYIGALSQLPMLAGFAAQRGWDANICLSALAAFAVGAGNAPLGELLLEVDGQDISEILEWYVNR